MTTPHHGRTDQSTAHQRMTHSSGTIVGRLGSVSEERELPSGDIVTSFTVIVDRTGASRRRATRGASSAGPRQVDAIPCQAFTAVLRRRIARLEGGTLVEVVGTLRRRFWRAGTALGSAMEVDVQRMAPIKESVQP